MAKVSSLEIAYEMARQPMGQYTSDKMSVRCLVTYEPDETPDMVEEIKLHSGRLKLACHKRITAPMPVEPK